jgi:hypothetical protein
MKLELTKISRDDVIVSEEDNNIVVRIDGKVACKFCPTDPTGFYMQVGEVQSYSNEIKEVIIRDAFKDEK